MKSFCSAGLIAVAIVSCTSGAANAQGWSYPYSTWPDARGPRVASNGSYWNPNESPAPTAGSWETGPQPEASSQTNEFMSEPTCESCDMCCGTGRNWYAIASGLVMGRNRAPAYWTTTANGDPLDVVLNTQDAGAGWAGGGQITVGFAWNGAGGPAIAYTYWGLGPMQGYGNVVDTTGNPATALDSRLDWGTTTLNGTLASTFFDDAQEQAVWRTDRATNMEINVLSGTYTVGSFQVAGLAGFRYFRFSENLIYGSASFGNSFSSNGGADAGYLEFRCRNNLYGPQIGGILSGVFTERLTGFAVTKVAICGNQMNNLTLAYAGDAVSSPDIYYTTNKVDASVLSELDFGLSWAFKPNWRFIYGYRVVTISNVSLGDNQFASYGMVEQNGAVILHGAFFGLGWSF